MEKVIVSEKLYGEVRNGIRQLLVIIGLFALRGLDRVQRLQKMQPQQPNIFLHIV